MIRIYWDYFKYIMEHKKNVFKVCFKKKLYIHAFTHDLSKFRPREFKAYALYFHGDPLLKNRYKKSFDIAWLYHQHSNKHHWNYWVNARGEALPMPDKYIEQMIADWEAMGIKFGNTAKEYYLSNGKDMILHRTTRCNLEFKLGIISATELVLGECKLEPDRD